MCTPINECQTMAPCPEDAVCVDMDPPIGYKCVCLAGYAPEYSNGASSDSAIPVTYRPILCVDVNECEAEVSPCHQNATCTNTKGAYECSCNGGLVGDGKLTCEAEATPAPTPSPTKPNSCAIDQDCRKHSNQQCINSVCVCRPGTFRVGPNCQDVLNCDVANKNNNCDIHANCIEESGLPGFRCECKSGWEDAYAGAAGTACTPVISCGSTGATCSSGNDCCSGICA